MLLIVIASHPDPKMRDQLLHTMFNLIKRPDRHQRFVSYFLLHLSLIVLMRDEKEGRKWQARSNKQQGKATQYTQGSHFS